VDGARVDVTPVTLPLLGAPWYRTELATRHGLLPGNAAVRWEGEAPTAARIVNAATRAGRPVLTSVAVPRDKRARHGGAWTLRGAVWVHDPTTAEPGVGGPRVDAEASARVAALLPASLFAPVRPGGDGIAAWVQGLLRCPALAATGRGAAARAQLDSLCNYR
jgi:hypothetical protein